MTMERFSVAKLLTKSQMLFRVDGSKPNIKQKSEGEKIV